MEFDPTPPSPFDPSRSIESMTIPEHLLRGVVPEGKVTPSPVEGGFTFAIGDRAFRYDHLGLRREG